MSRVVFTPSGFRDCAEPTVVCRLLIRRAEGTAAASPRLTFTGPPPPPPPSLTVTPTGSPGTFLLEAPGLGRRDLADLVQICADGPADPPRLSDGRQLWGFGQPPGRAGPLDRGACGYRYKPFDVVAVDADRARLTIGREFFSGSGWSDCEVDQCYVKLQRLADPLDDDVVGLASLPFAPTGTEPVRPAVRIIDPPPHRPGQRVSIELRNLPDDFHGMIGVCHVDRPWGCWYDFSTGGTANRVTSRELTGWIVQGCGLDRCYLEIKSGGGAMPPMATVMLPMAE